MNSRKPLLRLAVFALVAGVLWSSPSRAYKMLRLSSTNTATYVACNYTQGFAHWPWNQGTISWYHNTAGAGAGKASIIQAAIDNWTGAPESDHVLSYAGTTSAGYNLNDNQNTMVWASTAGGDLCGTKACHAITTVRYTTSQQVIQEVDIVYNQQMDWRTDGTFDSTCSDGVTNPDGTPRLNVALDTLAIVTHELGHSLGLGHSTDSTATMGDASCKVEGRSLNMDDRAGLNCTRHRYPLNPSYEGVFDGSPVFNCSQVSGWAWNSNHGGDPVYVNILDGSTLKGVVAASQFRGDLLNKGNGFHGFTFTLPSGFRDGQWHSVSARFSGGTEAELTSSPKPLICGVELFPGSMDPDDPPLSTGGLPYEVATQFESTHAGYVTHIGYYFSPQEGAAGSHTVHLWSDTGQHLASAPINPPVILGQIGWSYASIGKIAIQPGVRYRASVNTIAYQSKSSCGTPTSLQNPYVSGPLKAWQGFWKQGSGVFPTTSSCSNFFVSVRFEM